LLSPGMSRRDLLRSAQVPRPVGRRLLRHLHPHDRPALVLPGRRDPRCGRDLGRRRARTGVKGTLPPAQLFSVPGHNRPGKQPLFRQRLKRQRIVYPGGEVTMSQVKEEIINELNDLPPRTYGEVLDFIRLLKSRRRPGHRARERARAPEGLAPARGGRGVKRFVKGDVVVVPSPFSDISTVKRRPALVVTTPDENDVVLCQTRCSDRNGAGAPQGATSRASRSGTPTPSVSLTWTLQRERSENPAMSGQTGSSLPVPT
jgi:hypothetical protein